jgi:hypothetical protein
MDAETGSKRAFLENGAGPDKCNDVNIGDKVKLRTSGEVGIVVWLFDLDGWPTAYVAFFGADYPVGTPKRPPYVLRYALSNLERVP